MQTVHVHIDSQLRHLSLAMDRLHASLCNGIIGNFCISLRNHLLMHFSTGIHAAMLTRFRHRHACQHYRCQTCRQNFSLQIHLLSQHSCKIIHKTLTKNKIKQP